MIIKVRGWHSQKKIMFSAEEMAADQLALMPDGSGFANISSAHTRLSIIYDPTIFIPLLYTVIRDKNGKEIYAGDILADDFILGVVAYNQTPDCIYAGSYSIVDKDGFATDWDGVEPEHWHEYEVIGNIYENPELLKEVVNE